MTSFEDFGFSPQIMANLAERKYQTPTDVQAAAIPEILAKHDVVLQSHTGSGKEAIATRLCMPLAKYLHLTRLVYPCAASGCPGAGILQSSTPACASEPGGEELRHGFDLCRPCPRAGCDKRNRSTGQTPVGQQRL